MCKIIPPLKTAFPISQLPAETHITITTSSQHLNRIDAVLRSRDIFLGKLAKFLELRGLILENPILESRKVDLHSLHHAVARQGGYDKVSEQNKWVEVAKELHYKDIEPMALALQEVYKTIIHPYVTVVKGSDANSSTFVKGVTQEPKAELHPLNMSSYEKERVNCVDLQIQEASSKLEEIRRNVTELPAQEQETDEDVVENLQELYLTTGFHAEFEKLDVDQNFFKVPKALTKPNTNDAKKHDSECKMSKADSITNVDLVFGVPGLKRKFRGKSRLKRLQHQNACQKCKKSITGNQVSLKCPSCKKCYHIKCIVPEMSKVPKVITRRGDLEMLGYNIVHLMTGHLPWEDEVDYEEVARKKNESMEDIENFLSTCFMHAGSRHPVHLELYFLYLNGIESGDQPDYGHLKFLLKSAIEERNYRFDGIISLRDHARPNKTFVKGVTQEPKVERHALNMSRYEKERINCVDLQIQEASSKLEEIRGNVTELSAQEQEREDEVKELEKVYLATGVLDGFENLNFEQDLFKVPEDLPTTTRRGTKRNSSDTTEHEPESTTNNDFVFKQPGLPISGLIRQLRRKKLVKKLQKQQKALKKGKVAKRRRRALGKWNSEILEVAYYLSLTASKKERPSSETVEQKFWQIVGEKNSTVDTVVEYGTDFIRNQGTKVPSHTAGRMEITRLVGPSRRTPLVLSPRILYKRLMHNPWNLKNIAASSASALSYINQPISRMQVPWMNIGMIFSTFGWHCEPHWCYYINHLHFGHSKTWYAVPGQYAEKFEETMKELAPELFEDHPEALLLLDTLVNPNALMEKGVPVYRMDQNVGEFVITFPRAYICSFNHGFNVAEAINFAPADWIKIGRKCVEEYALLKKDCLFSQDELIFKIAKHAANADVRIAAAVYHDLYYSIKTELKLRQFVVGQWGCSKEDDFIYDFERMPDDRQCFHCKTTIYLSAVTCKCAIDAGNRRMVCIKHYDKLCTKCTPQNHWLMRRYFSNEMYRLFENLRDMVDPYEKWVKRMRFLLRKNPELGSCEKEEFENLLNVEEQNCFPSGSCEKEEYENLLNVAEQN